MLIDRIRVRADAMLGVVGAMLVVAPLFAGNALLGLDVAVLPNLRVPESVWGLGPDVPRRGLWLVPTSWLGSVIGGSRAIAVLLVLALMCAYVGVVRLCADAPARCRVGAGVLYAFSPFVFTRIGVGHLSLVLAMALLPWALTALVHPVDDLRLAFRWGVALALTGPMGGGLALVLFAIGIALDNRQRLRAVTVAVASQAVWLLPLLVASRNASGSYADSSSFATDAGGIAGLPRLLAGDGFWARSEQVGLHDGVLVALIGVALLLLALLGQRDLPQAVRRPLAVLAVVGVVTAASSELPVVSSVTSWLTGSQPFAAVREGQRVLPLALLWVATAAAFGAARLAHGLPSGIAAARRTLPLALGLVLAGPGLWGAGGRLATIDTPPEWGVARDAVAAAPGTVLVLPLHQHVELPVARGRRVLNPLPELFSADVIASTALELGVAPSDPVDRRQLAAARALADAAPISASVRPLGVRWVALLPGLDDALDARVAADPGFVRVVNGPNLELFRATTWTGSLIASGTAVPHDEWLAPLWHVDDSGPAVWHRADAWGWLRGFDSATEDDNGEVSLPSGGGLVWYWPAIPIVGADLLIAAALVVWRKPADLRIFDVKSLSDSTT